MEGGRSRRPLLIGLVIVAVAAGVALTIVLGGGGGGDDDDDEKSTATVPSETTATTEATATERTETTTTRPSGPPPRDARQIERTVTTFVEAAEQSDSELACSQVAGGAGRPLEACAAAAGINLRQLPSSDELEVSSVSVSGDSGTAKLSNGSSFSLSRSGSKWLITGFKPGPASGG